MLVPIIRQFHSKDGNSLGCGYFLPNSANCTRQIAYPLARYNSHSVTVKTTMPENTVAVSPERRAKFDKEVLMLSKVKHDNIVEFVGASLEPAMLVVTEFMGGGTLQKYLWSLRPKRLDLKLAIKFALDISHAMEYLHSNGIIHHDLKPTNLLLTNDKTVKVADLGLAREATEEDKTIEAGTYRWMAPELFNIEGQRRENKAECRGYPGRNCAIARILLVT